MDRAFYVYIVASRTRVLYTGVTSNLERRVWQHKQKQCDGFTAKYNCNRLVWFESYSTAIPAITREKQIKGLARAKKLTLIDALNPTWIDLSEQWGKPLP